jgi:hypothetical protein
MLKSKWKNHTLASRPVVSFAPKIPGRAACDDVMTYSNRVAYYVKLSNGLIATRPEDFTENTEKKKEWRPKEKSEAFLPDARALYENGKIIGE